MRPALGMSDSSHARAGVVSDVEAELRARGARRQGRNWRFVCPAHDDHRPSADYEPTLRVWTCRVCQAGGGVRDLARRLGLEAAGPSRPRPALRVPRPPPGISREDWIPAWVSIVDEARRQDRRLAPHRGVVQIADWLRPRHQAVADARGLASALGEADPAAWRLLRLASRAATAIAAVEAELDQVRRYVA